MMGEPQPQARRADTEVPASVSEPAGRVALSEYMRHSAVAREGVTAILEKRPPRFAIRLSADMPPFYPWGMSGPFSP